MYCVVVSGDVDRVTWAAVVGDATSRWRPDQRAEASREAGWMAEEACGDGRAWALLRDSLPTPGALERFEAMVVRRKAGEPLQYIIGHWPFRALDLLVDRRALIPRPETEQVAEVALGELDRMGLDAPIVVDLGTGTGALVLAIVSERPGGWGLGVDRSRPCVELAMENRTRVGLDSSRVTFSIGSWFAAVPADLRGHVDLIVTNPPYVATVDELDESVRGWEPDSALFAGVDGLDDLRTIIAQAPDWLTPTGTLVGEIGATQADAVMGLARGAGFGQVEIRVDLAGRDRILVARRS